MQNTEDHDKFIVTTVTDDDGDNEVAHVTTATATEQDRLRIAAEKRRQKILDQANTRMSIVEGTYNSSSTTAATNTEETVVTSDDVTKLDSVVEDTATTKVETETPVEPSTDTPATDSATTTTTSSTTSSKLAAMRRRRFQKKAIPSSTPVDIVPSVEDTATTATETLKSSNEPTTTEKGKKFDESTKVHGAELLEEVMTNAAKSAVTSVTPQEPEDTSMEENTTTTKKYLGVAKMRRRMIKERQEQQQQQQVEVDDDSQMKSVRKSNVHGTATSKQATSNNIVLPKKHRPMITTLPILMYAVTTLLLFITGLNIGLQQTQINYCYNNNVKMVVDDQSAGDGYCYNTSNEPQWTVVIHSELAPRKMGGLQRLLSVMNIVPPTTSFGINKMIITTNEEDAVVLEASNDDAEDEFSANEPTVKTTSRNGNIDPLFQVDLDALTTGDGLYFTLGRFAVRMHRFILTVLFYTPKSILASMVSFFWSFVQTPPILFIMALFIRHGLGKIVLGAKLPSAVVDETQHKDILSTVKTFVMKFLLSSFPTITIVYDVWTYIRSDMYVMLCGLFVGIALSHHHQAGSPYGETTNTISTTTFTTINTPIDGIADEL